MKLPAFAGQQKSSKSFQDLLLCGCCDVQRLFNFHRERAAALFTVALLAGFLENPDLSI